MASDLYSMERVTELPPELLACLSDTARFDMARWATMRPVMLGLTREMYLVCRGKTPLFVAGAMQLNLFDPTRELWLYSTTNLKPFMLRRLRGLFQAWAAQQPGTLYARADSTKKVRFLNFFSFQFVLKDADGIELYEVRP